MNRRTVLRTAAVVGAGGLAGCGGAGFSGTVGTNETPLSLEHSHDYDATPSGTRYEVTVTATNKGEDPIPGDGRSPNVKCVFEDGDGNTLHETAKEVTETVRPSQSVDLRFVLAIDVEEAKRYVLSVRWVSDQSGND